MILSWLHEIAGWDYLQILLILGGLTMLGMAWKMQNKGDFDFRDLIREDGKISLGKFAQFGAFCISTWVFIHLSIKDHLTEWYYSTYMLSWAGANLVNAWINTKNGQQAMYTDTYSRYGMGPQYSQMGGYWRDQTPNQGERYVGDADPSPVVHDVEARG